MDVLPVEEREVLGLGAVPGGPPGLWRWRPVRPSLVGSAAAQLVERLVIVSDDGRIGNPGVDARRLRRGMTKPLL